MKYVVIAVLALSVVTTTESFACVPIGYGDITYPEGTPTQQIVARAASIEIMRVERREFVVDPGIREFGAVHAYTLRPLETVAGRSRGRLMVRAFDDGAPYAQWRRINERWWEPPFDRMPNLAFPDIQDEWGLGISGCDGIASFQLGRTYLVFRDRAGAILRPTHVLHSSTMGDEWMNGPSFEPIEMSDPLWLEEVRGEVARQGPRQPVILDWLFDAVIGPPRN